MIRARRAVAGIGAAAGLALGGSALWVHHRLEASLPITSGRCIVLGLRSPVAITRDALGVPTIRASNPADAAYALGFLHAQERYFQMDLLRRRAAGELAALFGRAALATDREVRVHRFRDVARRAAEAANAMEREELDAYVRGVAAGLAALGAPPFEYALLRTDPEAWKPEDTLLVVLSMFLQLQDARSETESAVGLVHDVLPESLAAFVDSRGSEWDAPLDGSTLPRAPLPSAAVLDLRDALLPRPPAGRIRDDEWLEDADVGSNNWVVAGARMADGHAWLAGDMHLVLGVPNIWYRATLAFPDSTAAHRERVTGGVTLPGAPAIIAGTNGDIAWAFTNSETDAEDLVVLDSRAAPNPAGVFDYETPHGVERSQRVREPIAVKGAPTDTLVIDATIWGPVVDRDHAGRRRALRWTAHEPAAVNMHLLALETATSVETALALAPRCGIPAQNMVVADRRGHIGWTIAGVLPRRVGFDGRTPRSWASGDARWDGWLEPEAYPRIVDPPQGCLWTANQRCVGGAALARIGDAGYALGARAKQLRDTLLELHGAHADDLLRLQLDDRALFLERWRDLVLGELSRQARRADPRRDAARKLVQDWGGRAATQSVGYRIVRTFRALLVDEVFGALVAPCKRADGRFDTSAFPSREGPVWELLAARPPHMLPAPFRSWDDCIAAAVDSTLDRLAGPAAAGRDAAERALAAHTWGERNTTRIRHPLSRALPRLARWLDMPAHALPGDSNMPRVQSPSGGASQRMVVSPGQEATSLFEMPCGESGHPLSPHYRDQHAAWEAGAPVPWNVGGVRDTLFLIAKH